MRRRSPVLLLVCLLAFATGQALFGLGVLVTGAPRRSLPSDPGPPAALVRGFYDSVNAMLRSGDPAELTSLLSAEFVGHGEPPGVSPTRAGFVARLLALRATFPAVRLRPQNVFAHGDIVVARVHVEAAAESAFLGLPLADDLATWGTVDVFRIADGAIAEHWGGRADAPLLQPLHNVPLDLPTSDLNSVALERTTIAPGAGIAAGSVFGPKALYLEDGRLTVAIAEDAGNVVLRRQAVPDAGTTAAESVAPASEAVLAPGNLLLLPLGSRATFRNDGNVAAMFLTISVRVPNGPSGPDNLSVVEPAGESVAGSATPGVTTADLAGRPLVALSSGPALLAVGRATLAPGAALPVAAPGTALVAIESGSLELANTEGTVWIRHGAHGAITTATDRTLGHGDGVLFQPRSAGEMHSVAEVPLVLLVVTITPVFPTDGQTATSRS